MTKRKKKKKTPAPIAIDPAAETRKKWIRGALVVLAGAYLLTLWLDTVSGSRIARFVPRTWLFFAQIAALFPQAKPMTIEYRAESWSCADHKWHELDVRPYFPLDADNKENRFQRALQFYRKNRTVMNALDDYLVRQWNADGSHGTIGGVRFLSLRIPIPKIGGHIDAYTYKPLTSYPPEQRHDWYWTKKSRRAERCGDRVAPKEDEPDEPKDTKDPEP
jgi:hypothetical protein